MVSTLVNRIGMWCSQAPCQSLPHAHLHSVSSLLSACSTCTCPSLAGSSSACPVWAPPTHIVVTGVLSSLVHKNISPTKTDCTVTTSFPGPVRAQCCCDGHGTLLPPWEVQNPEPDPGRLLMAASEPGARVRDEQPLLCIQFSAKNLGGS